MKKKTKMIIIIIKKAIRNLKKGFGNSLKFIIDFFSF